MKAGDVLARLALLPVLLGLGGCSVADLVNVVTPRRGYELTTDIPYGPGPRDRLDLYRPAASRPGLPLIVFVYGGAWTSGSKAIYRFVGQAFASRGYPVVIPDYRIYPDTLFPGFVEDVARSVAFVASHREELGAEDRPVVLAGHSAGAQIALLLTLDKHYLIGAGAPVCATLAGAVGLAGPYDFLPLKEERYKRIFPEQTRAQSQPIAFADGRAPPVLLAAGAGDRTVDPGNTARLAARIADNGGRVETRFYPGIGHIGLVGAFAWLFRYRAPVLDDVDAFLRRVAGAKPPFCS